MIIIAGATGYIGRYLCSYLKERNSDVIALERNSTALSFLQNMGVKTIEFDILNDNDYKKLPTRNVEAIINLAVALPEHEIPTERFHEINVVGNNKLLEFAHKNSISRYIMASTHKVYNDIYRPIITEMDLPSFQGPHSPYIISKLTAEYWMQYYGKEYGMDTIVLRLTGVQGYGALMGFLKADGSYTKSTCEIFMDQAMLGKTIEVWGDINIRRSHVYIKDVVRAFEAAIITKNGTKGIFNVSCGIAYNQYEEALVIAKVFTTDKGISNVVLCPNKPGLTRGYQYSIEKIKSVMGWEPQFSNLFTMYLDYKKEWEEGRFHNYHNIKEEYKPLIFK